MAARRLFGALASHSNAINPLNGLRQLYTAAIGCIPVTEMLPRINPYYPAAHRFAPSFIEKCPSDSSRSYVPSVSPIFGGNEGRLSVLQHVRAMGKALHFYCTAVEESDSEANAEDDVEEAGDENPASNVKVHRRELSPEEVQEAAEIGYSVVGRTKPWDGRARRQEPIFAVIQIGSHQFKVCRGDYIYIEKLKYADVNDKLILNKVLMLGTKSQTIIGRPILPGAAVHAVVEEQALDATVIIFKKKRRKNYRRTNFHRQELTRLRITGVKGLKESLEATSVAA